MRVALALVLTLSASAVSAVRAQNPASSPLPLSNAVQIVTTANIASLADSLPAGASAFRWITRWDGLASMISRRDSSGISERHEQFSDIFVVERGQARLVYGGTAEGERATGPGEWRGGAIRGGTEAEIKPGDIVVIPAGIPHQVLLPSSERFYYFVFKVAKPAAK